MSEPTFVLPELSENLVTIIAPLGDEPNVDDGLSAQQLRNKFDEGGKNIRNFLNNTLSPAIKNFLRSLNTAISDVSSTLTSDYRTASAQDEIDTSLQSAVADKADHSHLCYVITGAASLTSIQAGSYVIVKNSTITGITDGLYTAAQAIPANTEIDSTYLTAVNDGGLNSVKNDVNTSIGNINTSIGNINTSLSSKARIQSAFFLVPKNNGTYSLSLYVSETNIYLVMATGQWNVGAYEYVGALVINSSGQHLINLKTSTDMTVSVSGNILTITNKSSDDRNTRVSVIG